MQFVIALWVSSKHHSRRSIGLIRSTPASLSQDMRNLFRLKYADLQREAIKCVCVFLGQA